MVRRHIQRLRIRKIQPDKSIGIAHFQARDARPALAGAGRAAQTSPGLHVSIAAVPRSCESTLVPARRQLPLPPPDPPPVPEVVVAAIIAPATAESSLQRLLLRRGVCFRRERVRRRACAAREPPTHASASAVSSQ